VGTITTVPPIWMTGATEPIAAMWNSGAATALTSPSPVNPNALMMVRDCARRLW
jgi:acyl-coenzyme A synthetase/AMP-(fatty) acid ligase